MRYIIKPTNKFQKDLKRLQKRGYDMNLLKAVIKNYLMENHFHQRIKITIYLAITQIVENVTLHRTGC